MLGKYLSISDQAKIYLIVPSIAAVLLFLLPESPIHLAKNGKKQVSDRTIEINNFGLLTHYKCHRMFMNDP